MVIYLRAIFKRIHFPGKRLWVQNFKLFSCTICSVSNNIVRDEIEFTLRNLFHLQLN